MNKNTESESAGSESAKASAESPAENSVEGPTDNRAGFVYLVGAGCGEPDLLTIRGKTAIETADVIIYDRLISPEILCYAQPRCELCFVGKSPDKHYKNQSEINDLLIEKARAGNIVVRLKGGDPFVFGRGGEEALALKKHGVAFEVVPGVSSAIAVPAFAGIPVTYRGLSSSFTVITGHEDPQKCESSIAWEHIGKATETLVFLMGMANLPTITQKLLENGMSVATPVAIIKNGGSRKQQTVCGELGSIVALAKQHHLDNPAVIVIGQVVSLRKELQWFEKKPLFGQSIIVTRAKHQVSKLSAALTNLGAHVHEFPTIAFCAPSHPELLSEAVRELAAYATHPAYAWLIFTSVNGVEAFFTELYAQGYDARQLAGIKLVAIGRATQKALEEKGLRNILIPEKYCVEGLMDKIGGQINAGEKTLVVRAEEGRDLIPTALAEKGVPVTEVAAYKTISTDVDTNTLNASLRAGEFDAVTFTSSATVHNFMRMIDSDIALLSKLGLYSIGPVTSDTLRTYGLEPTVQATSSCIEGLVQAILEYTHLKHTHPEHTHPEHTHLEQAILEYTHPEYTHPEHTHEKG